MTPDPFTIETLALRWKCSAALVRDVVDSGVLRHFRLGGKLIRISWPAVEEFECGSTKSSCAEESLPPSGATENDVDGPALAPGMVMSLSGGSPNSTHGSNGKGYYYRKF